MPPAPPTISTPAATDADDAAAVLAHLSCDGDFRATAVSIRRLDRAAADGLRVFIDQCQQREGVVRTPLELLQLIALTRQYECLSAADNDVAPSDLAQSDVFRRGLEAHGQSRSLARVRSSSW